MVEVKPLEVTVNVEPSEAQRDQLNVIAERLRELHEKVDLLLVAAAPEDDPGIGCPECGVADYHDISVMGDLDPKLRCAACATIYVVKGEDNG